MKKMFSMLFALVIGLGIAASSMAQTYPYTNPVYTPDATLASQAIASGVASTAFVNNGIGTLSLQVSGTCTDLAGALKASSNGTTYETINVYPSSGTAASLVVPATSITATGIYMANVASYAKIRFENSAVTGSACAVTMRGSTQPFGTTR